MLEHLFGSKTRARVLRFFLQNPDQAHYIREIVREIGIHLNAVRKELTMLEGMGLVVVIDEPITEEPSTQTQTAQEPVPQKGGKHKYYKLHQHHVLYPELRALFFKQQILGEHDIIKEIKEKAGALEYFVLTGFFVQAQDAPVDMLLVGSVNEEKFKRIIRQFEKISGQPVRYTIFTKKEFKDRRQLMDKFLYRVFEGPRIEIINNLV